MSRSIEQNLLSLMPTHGPQLPARLVDSARSLLAQSRQKASTLKAEEEVARMYACAHIACERFKIPLNLPPIEPRPPIPPRVYKRLYTHLDNILPNRSNKVNTPTTNRVRDVGGQTSPAARSGVAKPKTPSKDSGLRKAPQTPSKEPTLVNTPSKSTTRKGIIRTVKPRTGLPPWVRGVLGNLVTEHKQKQWGRFALAGVNHVIAPGERRTKDKWVLEHMPAIVAAVFHVSMDVVDSFGADEEATRVASVAGQQKTLNILAKARKRISVKGLDEQDFWEGWKDPDMRSLKRAINVVQGQWIGADWYRALEDRAQQIYEPENANPDGREPGEKIRGQKPDTMHQERYNFLSEEKRAEMKAWKEGILKKIEAAERRQDGIMNPDS